MNDSAGFIFAVGLVVGVVISAITAHMGVFSACHW
ncbi:hypothetical protein CfB38_2127 [Citrobacter freundii]|nr:hypothetical protein CfB38_2127 [Citrobacter freundii]